MTAAAAPETIYNELLQEVAACYLGDKALGEFALRRLRSRAEQLAKVNLVGSLEVRGHIELIAGDSSAARRLLDRALSLGPPAAEIVIRYMQGLQQRALCEAAYDVFSQYRNAIVGNVSATREAKQILASLGYLQVAHKLRAELSKMNASVEEVVYAPGEQLMAHFDKEGISDDMTAPVVGFVRKFFFDRGITLSRVGIVVIPAEGEVQSAILYEFEVEATADRAAELEWELYGKLDLEQFEVEVNRRLLFAVVSNC